MMLQGRIFVTDVLLQSYNLICYYWRGGNLTSILSSQATHFSTSEGNFFWSLLQNRIMSPWLTKMTTDENDDDDWLSFCFNCWYRLSLQFWYVRWPQRVVDMQSYWYQNDVWHCCEIVSVAYAHQSIIQSFFQNNVILVFSIELYLIHLSNQLHFSCLQSNLSSICIGDNCHILLLALAKTE